MADWDLRTIVQVGMRLIQHRDEAQRTWARVEKLLAEASTTIPALQAFAAKVAPELMPNAPAQTPHAFSVMWIQSSLNQLIGASLVVDGKYGNATRGAIENYQRARGLEVDGLAGPVTMAAIDAELRGVTQRSAR